MKTNLLNILKLLPIVMMAFTLSSCEGVVIDVEVDDPASNVDYSTEYLTSRVWVDEWTDDKGVFYHQELSFYSNRLGTDYMYTEDEWGYTTEYAYDFSWDWRNPRCTEIRMKYGPGDYSYMERIVMGGNKLDCLLDGQRDYFIGK